MKAKLVYVLYFVTIVLSFDCNNKPSFEGIEDCCALPSLVVDKVSGKCIMNVNDKGLDYIMLQCKITDCIMNDLGLIKNGNIDEDAALSYIDKAVDKDEWKTVYNVAVEVCLREMDKDLSEIVTKFEAAPFNITSDQCNVKYMSLVTCINLQGFTNCPQGSWTETPQCKDMKEFINDCADEIDSFGELIPQQKCK